MLARTLASSIVVDQQLQADLLGVEADRTQMQQVILNLCINSRDAMPEGGTITVSTSNVELTKEDARLVHSSAAPGRYVVLSIADTGHGMDATTRERLFEPFFTTKGGSGLGLSMVYGIIQSHNGHTRVKSKPGKGAVFTVYLPALPASIEETERQQLPEVIHGSGTVLVVDDELTQQELLARMLDGIGYKAILTSSGEEAIRAYAERKDEIDLVLLDMIMPGMSGEAVFDELKSMDPNVRVVLSSGYSQTSAAVAAQHKGALGFLEKPYNVRQLSVVIHQALNAKV